MAARVCAPDDMNSSMRDGAVKFPKSFYVYMLVDPRNGLPFYVGKGQRGRAWQHQKAVASGDMSGNERKAWRIREILAAKLDVEVQIVQEYELENDALEHEFELVDSLPNLTNIMPGGIGRVLSSEQIAQRVAERKKRIAKSLFILRQKEDLRRFAKDFRKIPDADRHQNEISLWLDQTKKAIPSVKSISAHRRGGRIEVRLHGSRPPRKEVLEQLEAERRALEQAAILADKALMAANPLQRESLNASLNRPLAAVKRPFKR